MIDKQNNTLVSFVEVLNAVSDAAIVLDKNFNCLFITEEAIAVFDLGKKHIDDIIGSNIFKMYSKLKKSSFYKQLQHAKETQETILYDEYLTHLNKWYKLRIYPSKDFYLVLTRNTTDEVNTFNQKKESEEYHRALIENVKDYAIFVLDDKGKIKTWNRGAERLLGYSMDEVIGKSPSIFYSKENRNQDFERKQLHQVKRDGKYEQEDSRVYEGGPRHEGAKEHRRDVEAIYEGP